MPNSPLQQIKVMSEHKSSYRFSTFPSYLSCPGNSLHWLVISNREMEGGRAVTSMFCLPASFFVHLLACRRPMAGYQ